jgi:hypothetical protein
MRRNQILAAAGFVILALLVVARVLTSSHEVTSTSTTGSVSPTTGVSPSAIPPSATSPTPLPTSSPGITGSVTQGSGTLAVTGQVVQTSALDHLASPAVWSPPPGAIALRWVGNDGSLTIAGPSFTNRVTTSQSLTLTFTARHNGVPKTFRSAAGECAITVSEALPTQMGGVYQCTQVSSEDGTLIVDAQGTFQASG